MNIRLIVILSILLLPALLLAQPSPSSTKSIDSLKQLYTQADKQDKVDKSIKIAALYSKAGDSQDSTLHYLFLALKYVDEVTEGEKKISTYLDIVHLLDEANQQSSADSLIQAVLNLTHNPKTKAKLFLSLNDIRYPFAELPDCIAILDSAKFHLDKLPGDQLMVEYYWKLGDCYLDVFQLLKGLNYLLKAEEIADEDNPELARINFSIGWVYNEMQAFDKTLERGLNAQKLAKKSKDVYNELFSIYAIKSAAFDLKKYDLVKEACQRAFEIKDSFGIDNSFGEIYYALGKVALIEEKVDLAIDNFQKGLELSNRQNDEVQIVNCQEGLSIAMLKKNDWAQATYYAEQAQKYTGFFSSDRNLIFSKIYARNRDYKKAFELLDKNAEEKKKQDSINNPYTIVSALLNEKFEEEKVREKERFEDELSFQKKIGNQNLILGLAAATIAFLIFLYFYNKRKNESRNRVLNRLVKEQTQEILEQKERLQELDQMKSRLYTNITHEFRTPLTVVLGMTNQLETAEQSTTLAKVKKELSLIRRNGKDLLNLINQILDLSKIEDNTLKVNYVQGDAIPYIRYITESFHSLANAQNISLRVEPKQLEILMNYDPEKFRQILANLLSNAIKYTSSGEKVLVSIDRIEQAQAPYLQLKVIDSGAGIPAKDLPNIFDRFYQADDSVAKSGGTGIGLALTKELVKLMEGKIDVESELGKGTIFTVSLPIRLDAAPEAPAIAADGQQSSTTINDLLADKPSATGEELPHLLIIEDNPDVMEYLAACLQGQYQLSQAYNGRAGIEKAFEIIPDIIISDVMMPEKDGFEVCDTLKNDERSSHIPIILLTAKADVESRIAGLRRGADAYLGKPFHQEELLVVLQNLLELRQKLQLKYGDLAVVTKYAPSTNPENKPPSSPVSDLEQAFLQKLRGVVEEHMDKTDLSPKLVCQQMGMSRSNLHRKLTALTNHSLTFFIRHLRLHKSKELLKTSDMTISEIAYEVGFADPKYFSRVFSEEFNQTPSKFRQN